MGPHRIASHWLGPLWALARPTTNVGHRPCINESFLMYVLRIEDADHVTGNHVIGLQNVSAWASVAAAGDQERFIYRRCLNANEGPSTLTTDCILWGWGRGGGEMDWREGSSNDSRGEAERGTHTHTHTQRERERERERFVLVNGWSVWLAFRDETRDCGLSGARSDNSLAWWPSFSHGYLYQIVVESLELSCRCQYAINYLFGSLRGSGSKTKCMSWKHNLR